MLCPRCGRPLRRSKKDPSFGLCDNCKKKYRWKEADEEDYEEEKIKVRRGSPKSSPSKSKKKKGGVVRIVLIVVAVFIVIGIVGSVFGNSGDKNLEADNSNPTLSDNGETTLSDNNTSSEAGETSNIFYPGDILETDNLKLTYISCGEYSDSNMFVEPGEGNKFVSFEFEFENTSDSDISVGSFDFSCYADGYEASQALITSDDSLTSIATLSPGRKASGIVVFEIPASAAEVEVEYETNFWTQDKVIFIYQ